MALTLVLAACGGGDDGETTATSAAPSPAAVPVTAVADAQPSDLKIWQADLKAVGCYGGAVDGLLGPKTEAAIKSYQTAKGLTVNGLLDAPTEAALEKDVAARAAVCTSGGSGTSASLAGAGDLKVWQADLNKVGCYAGPVDGQLGSLTEAAIHSFQAAKGLTVDGILGPRTRSALTDAAAAGTRVCAVTGGGGATIAGATAALSSPNYAKDFAIGSCARRGSTGLDLQAQADGITLLVSAADGKGTLRTSGGTEGDGIILNGTVSAVQSASNGITVTGTFDPPNNTGERFTLQVRTTC
jgi:peptidoglycan hydrolase-like protein with peptidoglycan-binding domain